MAVPANPKLTQVIAEFLAPATTKLSQFLRGGAYVPNTVTNTGVPTVLPIKLSQLAGAARAPVEAVSVQGAEIYASGGAIGGTMCHYTLTAAGVEKQQGNPGGVVTIGTWLLSGSAANCEVFMHVISDSGLATRSGAAVETWLPLNVDRTWSYGDGGIDQVAALSMQVTVRPIGEDAFKDVAAVYMESERF